MNQKQSRREFFRKCGRKTFATAVTGTVLLSSIVGTYDGMTTEDSDATVDPLPLSKKDASSQQRLIPCSDVIINGFSVKLCGISHTRSYASEHYDHLEELVRGAAFVISEGDPEDTTSRNIKNDATAYFKTLHAFCHRNGKNIVSLDPRSSLGGDVEFYLQGVGSAIYTVTHAQKVGRVNKTSSKDHRKNKNPTRREVFKTGIGFYFFASAFAPGGLLLKSQIGGEEDPIKSIIDKEPFFYDHIIDQRNVELTSRLKDLSAIVPAEEFEKGKYVLVNFGRGHTLGIEYYLKHPFVHRIKEALYAPTYGLLDSNEIAMFTPIGHDEWQKRVLS